METLTAVIDARDSHTAGHSRRVQNIALAIGRDLRLSQQELDVLSQAALFHDIGKLAVPEAILLKPAHLDSQEWRIVRRHPGEGARLLGRLSFLADALPAIRHHHERDDGSGYPDGLVGEEIPLGARIVNVADALDAMLTPRVYRPARAPLEASPLAQGRGGVPSSARGAWMRSIGSCWPALPRARTRFLQSCSQARSRWAARSLCLSACPGLLAFCSCCSNGFALMAGKRTYRVTARVDPKELAAFQAGIRKRYSDEEILAELQACATRIGRSPTMREFGADPQTKVHPQTVIERFGELESGQAASGADATAICDERGVGPGLRELGERLGRPRRRGTSMPTAGSCPRSRCTGTRLAR